MFTLLEVLKVFCLQTRGHLTCSQENPLITQYVLQGEEPIILDLKEGGDGVSTAILGEEWRDTAKAEMAAAREGMDI